MLELEDDDMEESDPDAGLDVEDSEPDLGLEDAAPQDEESEDREDSEPVRGPARVFWGTHQPPA